MGFNLYPSFLKLEYHSPNAPHVQIIPCRSSFDKDLLTNGGWINWMSEAVDFHDVVDSLVAVLKPLLPNVNNIDQATAYNVASPTNLTAFPLATYTVDEVGTAAGTYYPASQATYSFRTSEFNKYKCVLLDIVPNGYFLPKTPADFTSGELALFTALNLPANPFCGRDNNPVGSMTRITYTLNDGLRRAYHMT